MAYLDPTPTEIKAKLVAFASTDDSLLELAIEEAKLSVDQALWTEADYTLGVMYLAAHLVATWGAGAAAPGGQEVNGLLTSGGVSKVKVGDTEIGFADGGASVSVASGSGRYGTVFGRMYELLRARNIILPMWV